MAVRLELSPAALRDIDNHVRYIAEDNPVSAQRFGVELRATLSRIELMPQSFRRQRLVPEIRFADVRVARVSSRFSQYLIFFKPTAPETYRVVRVLHGKRDLPALLRAFR